MCRRSSSRCWPGGDAAIVGIIDTQLGRRHLTPEQKSDWRGKRDHLEKTAGHGEHAGDQNDPQTTAQRLGKEYGVGEATIKRDAEFAEAVDTQLGRRHLTPTERRKTDVDLATAVKKRR